VFVVATANDVRQLPPEFTRKGRVDEVFFVGLPEAVERRAIWQIHLQRPRKLDAAITVDPLVSASAGYTGAEIAEAVVTAMFQAFEQGERPVGEADLTVALRETVPMSRSHADAVAAMLAWGQACAMPAS
jgi:SpoVK/Ycf46/Vps4 family AAA+-type ATPase